MADGALDIVRTEVRRMLESSQAYQGLDPDKRKEFAQNLVKVASYLSDDPGWLSTAAPLGVVAEGQDAVDDLKKRMAKGVNQAGKDFRAGAMREGTEAFEQLVDTVDFPAFVTGLIQGVFQSIVDASIQQMQAYGELLAATAKSVGEFANDHIPESQAREQIASRFPGSVKIERDANGSTRLAPTGDDADMGALQQMTNSKERIDLSSEEGERKFLTAARLELARQRQKMMAMMVMLGINRIIVTNGRINAKVIFDIKTEDLSTRRGQDSLDDQRSTEAGAAAAAWAPWGAGGGYARTSHKTRVRSSVDDYSSSKAQMKAQLSGEVRVDFRSETLPPEKLLDSLQMEQMTYLSQAQAPAQGGQRGAAQPAQGART